MRDPFESSPALRLGDAKANPRETGIIPNAEIVAIEPPNAEIVAIEPPNAEIVAIEPPKTDTAIPRPPSLAPEFGDAFGEAFSKPRDRLFPAEPKKGERRAYTFDDVSVSIAGIELDLGSGTEETVYVSRKTLTALLGNVAHETRGARIDDLMITGVVRKPVGDGAMRYEPVSSLSPAYSTRAIPEVLSEAEFKRRHPESLPIDYGDASPAALLHNHTSLVAKKDGSK